MSSLRAKPDTRHGKEFEKQIHEAFRNLYKTQPIGWEHVVDTHAAGNVMKGVDADFRMSIRSTHPGRPWRFHIEAKASKQYDTLSANGARRELIDADQIGRMRLALRTGVIGLFMFKSMERELIEIWTAGPVCQAWYKKRFTWNVSPEIAFKVSELEAQALAFVLAFKDRDIVAPPYRDLAEQRNEDCTTD